MIKMLIIKNSNGYISNIHIYFELEIFCNIIFVIIEKSFFIIKNI